MNQQLAIETIGKHAAIVAAKERLLRNLLVALAPAVQRGEVSEPVAGAFREMMEFKLQRGTLPDGLDALIENSREESLSTPPMTKAA